MNKPKQNRERDKGYSPMGKQTVPFICREVLSSSLTFINRPLLVLWLVPFLLLFGATLQAAEELQTLKVKGDAIVAIADNWALGRSERQYYLADHDTGKTVRLKFEGPPPASFRTGIQFEADLFPTKGGYSPSRLIEIASKEKAQVRPETVRQQENAETKSVLTLLLDFQDAQVGGPGVTYGVTRQDVVGFMFENTYSITKLYHNASLGQWEYDSDADSDGQPDVYGPYQIDAMIGRDQTNECPFFEWMDKARAAWQGDNPDKSISVYQQFLYILPNEIDTPNSCWYSGWASAGCTEAVCFAFTASPGPDAVAWVAAHELGHNYWLDHAATDTNNNEFRYEPITDNEYGDWSDPMSSGRGWSKFNGPHADYMGWTDPAAYEIRPVEQTAETQLFQLFSMDDEMWAWPGLRGLKLPRNHSSTYYITYRLNAGDLDGLTPLIPPYNPGGWANRVNVHYVRADRPAMSFFVASLGEGESFRDPVAGLRVIAGSPVNIHDSGQSTKVMDVEICTDDCGPQVFSIEASQDHVSACIEQGDTQFSDLTLNLRSFDGVSEQVVLDFVPGLPGVLVGTFSPETVVTSGSGTKSVVEFSFPNARMVMDEMIRIEGNPENGYPRGVDIRVGAFDQPPGSVSLESPVDGELGVDSRPALDWMPDEHAFSYLLEVSRNPEFTDLLTSESVWGSEFVLPQDLPLATKFYWRVTPINPCGQPEQVPVWSFTIGEQGMCPAGEEPVFYFRDNFEGIGPAWEHEAQSGPDTWELTTDHAYSHDRSWQASKVVYRSDQHLISPPIEIPPAADKPKLEFLTRIDLDGDLPNTCYDGGILEYSIDQGTTWDQVPADRLESYPYLAQITEVLDNPLDDQPYGEEPRLVWCGKNTWARSLVDMDGLQGNVIWFRFRLGTGNWNRLGHWSIDDVSVFSCVSSSFINIFRDGFEPGEATAEP